MFGLPRLLAVANAHLDDSLVDLKNSIIAAVRSHTPPRVPLFASSDPRYPLAVAFYGRARQMVEVLARNNTSGTFTGIQVKTAVPIQWGEAHFQVRKATFAPGPSTYVAGLAWLPDSGTFADECLFIPTMNLPSVGIETEDHWVLHFHPHSPERTRLDAYRLALGELAGKVGAL